MFILKKEFDKFKKQIFESFSKAKEENIVLRERISFLEGKLDSINSYNNPKPNYEIENTMPKIKEALTTRERELVHLLTTSNEGMTYEGLASELGTSVQTVKTQVSSILKKGFEVSVANSLASKKKIFYLEPSVSEEFIKLN